MSMRPASVDTLERRAIARAKEGDWDAIHFLYATYVDDVAGYVRAMVSDATAVEQIALSVFARLNEVIDGYREADGAFATWLFGVVREATLEHLRASGRVPPKRFARRDGNVGVIVDGR